MATLLVRGAACLKKHNNNKVINMLDIQCSRSVNVLMIALASAMATPVLAGNFDFQLEEETVTDDSGRRNVKFEPRLRYREGSFTTHLEYEYDPNIKPLKDKKILEWQQDMRWTTDTGYFHMLTNEMYHNYTSGKDSGELTWSFYTPSAGGIRYGFELEVDYLSNDELALHEIEIEPTVKWSDKAGPGTLSLELEAPVTRLYSKLQNNVEFETVEFQVLYEVAVTASSFVSMEVVMPYDLEKKAMESELNLAWGTRF
jgi:hypothetical protein